MSDIAESWMELISQVKTLTSERDRLKTDSMNLVYAKEEIDRLKNQLEMMMSAHSPKCFLEIDRLKQEVIEMKHFFDVVCGERDRLKAELARGKSLNERWSEEYFNVSLITKDRDTARNEANLWKKQAEDMYLSMDTWRSKAERLAEALRAISKWYEGDKESDMGWGDMQPWGAYAQAALAEYSQARGVEDGILTQRSFANAATVLVKVTLDKLSY